MLGINIFVSPHALEVSEERLFPASRHRSRRIHKKLLKRFGGEFRRTPCIWRTPMGFVVHPSLYAELKARLDAQAAPTSQLPSQWRPHP